MTKGRIIVIVLGISIIVGLAYFNSDKAGNTPANVDAATTAGSVDSSHQG